VKALPAILVALALLIGLAGYLWRGAPDMPASPAPPLVINPDVTPEAEKASAALLDDRGDVRAWLTLSDSLLRQDKTAAAVTVLESAIAAAPEDVNLWVQLGVALTAHAEGEVVPAARLAFDRASRLDPAHPAPAFYLGLAWMQTGEVARAREVWRALLARSPADAPWRPTVEQQLAMAERAQAMAGSTGG